MGKKDIVLKKKNNQFLYIGVIAVLVVIIAILVIPGKKQDSNRESSGDLPIPQEKVNTNGRYQLLKSKDGIVSFPLSSFNDEVQYFQYQIDSVAVNFFVLKSNDGTIRAAFDACDVCYRSRRGYNQVGDYMQCNNCGQRFPEDKINVVKGGCNPAPLTREIVGDSLVIKVEDIAQGKRFF